MTTDTITPLKDAVNGFQALIDTTVAAQVEAAVAEERANMQRLVDNTVNAALTDVRTRVQHAISLLEGI